MSGDSIDRIRLSHLRGSTTDGFILRSLSSLLASPTDSASQGWKWQRVRPELTTILNGSLPYSVNDGGLWAGAGLNFSAMFGVQGRRGPLQIVLVPEIQFSTNADFTTNRENRFFSPLPPPWKSALLADPWYVQPYSADIPRRFGRNVFFQITPGQSTVAATARAVTLGFSTENEWWGPGIRNAILLSNNAPGFPHLFLRSTQPWRVPVGDLEWRWLVGGLTESKYFDDDPANNTRSISLAMLAWRPSFERNLTLGLGRAVYATAEGWGTIPLRWLDVFAATGQPANHPLADSSLTPGGRDQILSLFARWVFPADGFEAYGEWARQEFPISLRDFLADPTHSHGYTLGFQWMRPGSDSNTFRIQGEITTLEQSPSFRNRPVGVFYTSRRVLQGYTNQGQVLGASLGPGSSGQWLAVDWMAPHWSAGFFLDRTRNNEDVRSTFSWPAYLGYCNHDVSLGPGFRGSVRTLLGYLSASLALTQRRNVFYQNASGCTNDVRVDSATPSVSVTFRPGGVPRPTIVKKP